MTNAKLKSRVKELESIADTLNKVYQTSLETNKKQAQCIRAQRDEIELIKSKNEFLSKCVDSREQKLVKLEALLKRNLGDVGPVLAIMENDKLPDGVIACSSCGKRSEKDHCWRCYRGFNPSAHTHSWKGCPVCKGYCSKPLTSPRSYSEEK